MPQAAAKGTARSLSLTALRFWSAVLLLAVVFFSDAARAAWPTYRHDGLRSGVTRESVKLPLKLLWQHSALHAPRSAFPPPARQDFWHNHYGLRGAVDFDRAYHPVTAGKRVWYGSSADDRVVCLDSSTGRVLWSFFAEGPVRCAPVLSGGRLFFGSDDGRLYCLEAESGKLLWKRRLAPSGRRVPGNSRLISLFPVRGGPVVLGSVVYAACGVFPKQGSFLCALRASDGKLLYRTRLSESSPQGYLAATSKYLIVPSGRAAPLLVDRLSGRVLGKLRTGGGAFALFEDELVFNAPGRTTGQVSIADIKSREQLAVFPGERLLVSGSRAYVLHGKLVRGLQRARYVQLARVRNKLKHEKDRLEKELKKTRDPARKSQIQAAVKEKKSRIKQTEASMARCFIWRSTVPEAREIILAGSTLFVGCRDRVAALSASSGKLLWEQEVPGTAYSLSVGEGRLFVSTDQGKILCFAHGASSSEKKTPEAAGARGAGDVEARSGEVSGSALPLQGPPLVKFIAPGRIVVSWETPRELSPALAYGPKEASLQKTAWGEPGTKHEIPVAGLPGDTVFRLILLGRDPAGKVFVSKPFLFDSHTPLFHCPRAGEKPAGTELCRRIARKAFNLLGETRGYAFVLGWGCGGMTYELLRETDFQVIVLERDGALAAQARRELERTGLYGVRATVIAGGLETISFSPYIGDLILSEEALHGGPPPGPPEKVVRLLRPCGGLAYFETKGTEFNRRLIEQYKQTDRQVNLTIAGRSLSIRRSRLSGSGTWSHLYADPGNTACSNDTVQGPFTVQWFGRPGPRLMIDRHHRALGPLYNAGRVVIQGAGRLLCVNAYNGACLWDVGIPGSLRVNALRDCGHIALSKDAVYVAAGGWCLSLAAKDGRLLRRFRVPAWKGASGLYWGYVALVKDFLIGTAQKPGASLSLLSRSVPAGESYYDNRPLATSCGLFCYDRSSGKLLWTYRHPLGSALINSAIACSAKAVFFIESTDPEAAADPRGRLTLAVLLRKAYLKAVDLKSGKALWSRPFEAVDLRHALFLSVSQGVLLAVGTKNKAKHPAYELYAFNAGTGQPIWHTFYVRTDKPVNGDHGEQDQHPVLLDGMVISRPYAFDLRSGRKLNFRLDRGGHGCGALSACSTALFGRGWNPRIYPLEGKGMENRPLTEVTRPGCWINILPAGGLIFIPEASSGCTCEYAVQTSLALVPQER